jgi:hypothetical protein
MSLQSKNFHPHPSVLTVTLNAAFSHSLFQLIKRIDSILFIIVFVNKLIAINLFFYFSLFTFTIYRLIFIVLEFFIVFNLTWTFVLHSQILFLFYHIQDDMLKY